jgi:hypothetical protein
MDTERKVVVVEQWRHEHGPRLWFPYGSDKVAALRGAASFLCNCPNPVEMVARSVWVREGRKWVPA